MNKKKKRNNYLFNNLLKRIQTQKQNKQKMKIKKIRKKIKIMI